MEWLILVLVVLWIVVQGRGGAEEARRAELLTRRLRRVEDKLDLLLHAQGIAVPPTPGAERLSEAARAHADAGRKIAAIKCHREESGAGLAEAKALVEDYLAGR